MRGLGRNQTNLTRTCPPQVELEDHYVEAVVQSVRDDKIIESRTILARRERYARWRPIA